MRITFDLKDSDKKLQVWKVSDVDHYWTEIEAPNSKRFHESLTALVDYLIDKIHTNTTKKNLREALEIMFQ